MCFKIVGYGLLILAFQARNRVVTSGMPRMAAQETPQRKPRAGTKAMFL